jgi:hypothetical protein
MDTVSAMLLANVSSGGVVPASASLRSAPVRRRAGPISATGWLPRMTVTVSPRSTASSRSEKCRDASVAVIVRTQEGYLIIRFSARPGKAPGFEFDVADIREPFADALLAGVTCWHSLMYLAPSDR